METKISKMTESQIKGYDYEVYIKKFLLEENPQNKVWLWSDIPEFELKKADFLGSWNQFRLIRKENKINNLRDTGCDILIKDNNDKFIVVQCKNYAPKNSVTIPHLAGFFYMIAMYGNEGIVYYTSKLSCNLEELKPNPKIKFIKKLMDNGPKLKIKEGFSKLLENPYYYQIEAAQKLKNLDRAILSLPCGMGKTLTAIMIAKDYDNIVIISPLIAYSKQNLEKFENELEADGYQSIMINSEGTRNKTEILEKVSKNKKNILSLTYKSVDIFIEIMKSIKNKIIIIDEFHNLSKNDIYGVDEKTPLYYLLNSDSKILFMSATPKFYHLDYELDEDSENQIKKLIFGDEIYGFSMAKGIAENYICDYQVLIPEFSIKNNLDDISAEIKIDDLPIDLSLKAKFIIRGLLETGSKKCIIYLRNQEEAIQMTQILNTLNEYFYIELYTDYIISDIDSEKRDEILKRFNEFTGFALICSVSILDECIDIPKCDSIFITYPSESKIKNIQRLCRANRKDKFNPHKIANIFLWCNEFQEIGVFISNLKEFDESFTENKVLIMKFDQNDGGIIDRNQSGKQLIEYKNLDDYLISVRKLGFGIDKWKKNLAELKKFIEINDRKPVEKSSDIFEKQTGSFLKNQLYDFKNNQNIMKLIAVKNIWQDFVNENKKLFVSNNEHWQDKLNELEEFIIQNSRLPTQGSDENEETFKLAKWIVRNNEQYEKQEKSMNNQETREEWDNFKNKYSKLFNSKKDDWFDKIQQIIDFIAIHKRLPYESKSNKTEYDLKIWIKTQGKVYSKNKFSNEQERINIYEKLVSDNPDLFTKSESGLETWIEKYEQLIEFIKKYNRLPKEKPKTDDKELKSLGIWKSNLIQDAKRDFKIYIEDIDPNKLSASEKEKYNKKLEKFLLEKTHNSQILSQDSKKLNKKDKLQYDKILKKVSESNKKMEEERFESSEKLRLWNELKQQFTALF